jgi:hypothetical protein
MSLDTVQHEKRTGPVAVTLLADPIGDGDSAIEDLNRSGSYGFLGLHPVSGALLLRRSQGLGPIAGFGLALPRSRPLIH